MPVVFPYSIDVISVKREGGYSVQLEFISHPFVGRINTVRDDVIIISSISQYRT